MVIVINPLVPRMLMEVWAALKFISSSSFNGLSTLKNSVPSSRVIFSNLDEDLVISALESASRRMVLLSSVSR